MNRICPSCGGIIGRDCFNPQECAWITQSMEHQEYLDRQAQSEPAYIHPEEAEEQEEKRYSEAEVLDLLAAFKMSENMSSDPISCEEAKVQFPNVFNHKRLDALKWITITRKK